ncbi:glycosyltransferase, partial [Escherichia coli]|uniref:glycosyltransferase n=1 Tax=Escherichia coli TaxID=562 RepID=UPI0027393B5E
TPALEAAGFTDMQNCVFADEHDILDKLDYLFQNPDELERITNAGYQLVHSRHTLKQRDQIFQWFNLYKNLKSNQKIV